MVDQITDVINNGLTPTSAWVLGVSVCVFFAVLVIKTKMNMKIKADQMYREVKENLASGEGVTLRYGHATGFEDFVLQKVTPTKVFLVHENPAKCETLKKEVDIAVFAKSTKTYVMNTDAKTNQG